MRGHDVSDDADGSRHEWRRSSRSYGSGNCLEVAVPRGELIDVRDSKNPQGAILQFTALAWVAFITGVRADRLGR